MGQMERILQIKRWLDDGRCLTRGELGARLNVSWASIKRDLAYLRERMDAPLIFDRERGGWRLDAAAQVPGTSYEMVISLREDEVHALLAMQDLLTGLQPEGFLASQWTPLRRRLTQMLRQGLHAPARDMRRIRVLTLGARRVELPQFQAVAHAVLARKRLRVLYRARGSGHQVERDISPQRLAHYRENWYCDAWCHLRDGLRIFSVDAIERAQVLDLRAVELPDVELDELLAGGYGIFAGPMRHRARLRFSAERARWVAGEHWHPDQRGHHDAQGRWLLDLPYADPRELVMDILRHVPEVEVLWPEELAHEVRRRLVEGLRRMEEA